MRSCLLLIFGLFCALGCNAEPLGLYIRDGVLMKDGTAYSGVGVNYFDLFARTIRPGTNLSTLANLRKLSVEGVPFVRFMCGGYWPAEQQLYLTNRTLFFARLDAVVRTAETNRVGLIPSLFWYAPAVADLVGEPLDQYGNPESKCIRLIRQYTRDVVSRYHASPAIWAWEFGNEYNLDCDLPNAAEHRPAVVPDLGTAASRTDRDQLTFRALAVAFAAFAEEVRAIDKERLLLTGNAAPRISAWNNVMRKSWDRDNAQQFREILLRDNPDPFNGITVHLYPDQENHYPGPSRSLAESLGIMSQIANEAGKPLFLGEFGVSSKGQGTDAVLAQVKEMLQAIREKEIPLAAFWVFDLAAQESDFSATFENSRAELLRMIAKANLK